MTIQKYTAAQLFSWLNSEEDIAILDVRNSVDFARLQVESPRPFLLENISYYDFMEIEEACVRRVSDFAGKRPIRVVCAKEGSSLYVAEILERHGFTDLGYLEGGISSWGNLLVPKLLNPGETFEIYQFLRPAKASCSYAIIAGDEMLVVDPSRNVEFYRNFAQKKGAGIRRTFETHLQADYISGSARLAAENGVEFFANSADFTGARFQWTALEDGGDYGGSRLSFKALFTPGHTPGSTCYLVDNRWLLSGDTVFIRSVGRPDLGGRVDAWSDSLFDSLQQLRSLNNSVEVLPGHFSSWQEATEKDGSPVIAASLAEILANNRDIFAISTKVEFLAFIKAHMRPQPEEYATIRSINAGLERVDSKQAEILDLGKNECAAE